MSPGEAGVPGRAHLGSFGVPGEMVRLGVPDGSSGDGGASEDGRFAVVEGDSVVGKPGGESFTSAFFDGVRERTFKLDELDHTGGKRSNGEWVELGFGIQRARVGSGWLRVLGGEARRGIEEGGD